MYINFIMSIKPLNDEQNLYLKVLMAALLSINVGLSLLELKLKI